MKLTAIVNETEEIIETMWGDPNRRDNLQRRVYKLFLTHSNHDRENGYSLERLDLYELAVNPGNGSIQKIDYLPEQPIIILGDDRSPPTALNILKELDLRGVTYVRKKYF